jgi:soluble lytic murein transglycosylase-like protein
MKVIQPAIYCALVLCIVLPVQAYQQNHNKKTRAMVPPAEYLYYADACAAHYPNVPKELVRAVIWVESGWQARVVAKKNKDNTKNGRGMMQLLPSTAARYGVLDPFSPAQNVCGGTHYLSDLLDQFSDMRLAVAAYYAGGDRLKRKGMSYSNQDVIRYVEAVRARYLKEIEGEESYAVAPISR